MKEKKKIGIVAQVKEGRKTHIQDEPHENTVIIAH
jgi:hypothetical protein